MWIDDFAGAGGGGRPASRVAVRVAPARMRSCSWLRRGAPEAGARARGTSKSSEGGTSSHRARRGRRRDARGSGTARPPAPRSWRPRAQAAVLSKRVAAAHRGKGGSRRRMAATASARAAAGHADDVGCVEQGEPCERRGRASASSHTLHERGVAAHTRLCAPEALRTAHRLTVNLCSCYCKPRKRWRPQGRTKAAPASSAPIWPATQAPSCRQHETQREAHGEERRRH